MLLIECPWCGPRDEIEYRFGGQSHVVRPAKPDEATDDEWAAYLFWRINTKGPHAERWVHEAGCGCWFNVIRDTVNHEIVATYRMGQTPPLQMARGKTS